MKVRVDEDRCEGQAVCVGLAPQVFELGDEDEFVQVTVDDVPSEREARVRKAAAKCPMAALTIEE